MNRKNKRQSNERKHGWIIMAVLLLAVLAGILILCRSCGSSNEKTGMSDTQATPGAHTDAPTVSSSEADHGEDAGTKERHVQSAGNVIYDAEVFDPELSSVPCPVVTGLDVYQRKDTLLSLYGAHFVPDWASRQAESADSYLRIGTQEGSVIRISNPGSIECATKVGYDSEIPLPANQPEITYYYPQADFSWGTRQVYVEDVQSFFRSLGIETTDCGTRAVTSEAYEALYQQELPSWEIDRSVGNYKFLRDHIDYEDNELFYIVYLQQLLGEIPIYRFSMPSSSRLEDLDGTKIYAICSRNGLEKISLQCAYEMQRPGESKSILSFEKAVDVFNRYVNDDLLLTEPLRIGYVGLEYIPDSALRDTTTEITMKPYWVFRAEKPEDGSWPYFEDYLLDAVTGQVVIQ